MSDEPNTRMKPEWAELYNEHVEMYFKPNGECQNPHCGHKPITCRHVLRHRYSGDTLEIGHNCFGNWQAEYGIITEDHLSYNSAKELSKGRKVTGSEYTEAVEEERRKREEKRKKKPDGSPVQVQISDDKYPTEECAEEYAKSRGGYLAGQTTISGKEFWLIKFKKVRSDFDV